MRPVFDSNILIDYLLGIEPAESELAQFPEARISVVTWIEVMVGARDNAEESQLRQFLGRFDLILLDASVAKTAAMLRNCYGLRLADAVIWASAKAVDSVLITRNTKDFSEGEPDIRVPYRL